MSFAIGSIVERLIRRLIADGELVLAPNGTADAITREVLMAMAHRKAPAQLGSFFSEILVRSELVDELFIDDRSMSRLLSDL